MAARDDVTIRDLYGHTTVSANLRPGVERNATPEAIPPSASIGPLARFARLERG